MGEQLTIDDFDKITTLKADDRGRVTLGKEDYAGEKVKLVVVGVEE